MPGQSKEGNRRRAAKAEAKGKRKWVVGPLGGLVFSAVTAMAVLTYGVMSANANTAMFEEVKHSGQTMVFEAYDDLVGITDDAQGLRFEQGTNSAPKDVTKEKLGALAEETKKGIQADYGWDVTKSEDRKAIQNEGSRLKEVLHTIPDSALQSEDHKALRKLRDIVDKLNGETECRGRCLPADAAAKRIINLIAIGSAIAALEAEFADPSLPYKVVDDVFTAIAVARTIQAALYFTAVELVLQIRTEKLQTAVVAALFVTLTTVKLYKDDVAKLAKAVSILPKDGPIDEAKEIAELTPQKDDNTNDYDMVHDEL